MRIERLQKEYPIDIRWRAYPLHPDTPEEGLSMEKMFREKGVLTDVKTAMVQLKTTAESFGLPMGDRAETYNSRLAQELGLWAEAKGKGHEFHDHAFRVYFVEGKNLAQRSILLDMVDHVGLPRDEAEEVLDQRLFKAAVDRDWKEAKKREIIAVPTFYMGKDRLVGAQPYERLEYMVKKHLQA